MSKYTIEYRRTVRLAPYETLTIGLTEEFDRDDTTPFDAFEQVKNTVSFWVEDERDKLKPKEEAKKRGP